MNYQCTLVPIRQAFDQIGRFKFRLEWTSDEASAITLGKRSFAEREAWLRGRQIRSIMLDLIECERLPIVFYRNGRRERYATSATLEITDLFPCPTSDPDAGFIELGDQDIYLARADLGGLPEPKLKPSQPRGPKERFGLFREACLDYFRENGFAGSDDEVCKGITKAGFASNWPKTTRRRELIEQARAQIKSEPIGVSIGEEIASEAV